jgi:hypothetical protein
VTPDTCSAPLDWRLFLPESWDDTFAPDPARTAEIIKRRTPRPVGMHNRRHSAVPVAIGHIGWYLASAMLLTTHRVRTGPAAR